VNFILDFEHCERKLILMTRAPRDSATENTPPAQASRDSPRARAKRCGKSAPRTWQQERHGKPHREQDRIGMVASQGAGAFPPRRPGWSREAHREVRPRGMVVPHFRVRTEPGLQAVWRLYGLTATKLVFTTFLVRNAKDVKPSA
jgi:hypothetical protein